VRLVADLDASEQAPKGAPSFIAPERLEEFAPGLDKDLLALIQQTAELELDEAEDPLYGPVA